MRHIDLFSGICGFALAASWVWGEQHEPVVFCERDGFCQKIIRKHWPHVPCVDDIHNLQGCKYGQIDVLTGGFPCQPYSLAGKRRGTDDDRHLWPQMFRIIREAQPRWVLGENVPGIISMALDTVLADLEGEGYEVQTFLVPACGVNAPHRRDRVWIVAHAQYEGRNDRRDHGGQSNQDDGRIALQDVGRQGRVCADIRPNSSTLSDAESEQAGRLFERGVPTNLSASRDWTGQTAAWAAESPFCGVADGLSGKLYRTHRLRALGNAIVPQVAAVFFEMMKQVDAQFDTQSDMPQ